MAGGIASELAAAGFEDAVEIGRGGGGVVYLSLLPEVPGVPAATPT